MNLHECLLTNNACYKAGVAISPTRIVVHDTGAGNPNLKRYVQPDDGLLGKNPNGNDWNQPHPDERSVCVHAFIGRLQDGTVATYQTLPWTMQAWGVGAGARGSYNGSAIQFEICDDGYRDASYFNAVYDEAVNLCAYLCKLHGISTDDILCHAEAHRLGYATNHGDVEVWFGKFARTMSMFRTDVQRRLAIDAVEETSVEAQAKTPSLHVDASGGSESFRG
ncbi:MAG TPA: peptidoglycan recognition family protein [Polyangiaceae bacterium]